MKRILCGFLVALVIVCALLIAADLFNITQYIPLTQNYDWLAFIGAIIGGIATFAGVFFTLDYQKKSDEEKKRNDNAPIIKIDVSYKSLEEHQGGIFTLNGSEVYTSGFPKDYKKNYPIIELRLTNDKPAFDVCIDSCATREHTDVVQHAAYAPALYRLLPNECVKSMFWIQDAAAYESINILGIIRISYSDMFGNKYFQDAAFSYVEGNSPIKAEMEITGIRVPVLVDKQTPTLKERLEEEYPYFFNRQ